MPAVAPPRALILLLPLVNYLQPVSQIPFWPLHRPQHFFSTVCTDTNVGHTRTGLAGSRGVCTSTAVPIGTIAIKAAPRPPVPIPSVSLSCAWLPPHLNHLGAILLSFLLPLLSTSMNKDDTNNWTMPSLRQTTCTRTCFFFCFLLKTWLNGSANTARTIYFLVNARHKNQSTISNEQTKLTVDEPTRCLVDVVVALEEHHHYVLLTGPCIQKSPLKQIWHGLETHRRRHYIHVCDKAATMQATMSLLLPMLTCCIFDGLNRLPVETLPLSIFLLCLCGAASPSSRPRSHDVCGLRHRNDLPVPAMQVCRLIIGFSFRPLKLILAPTLTA